MRTFFAALVACFIGTGVMARAHAELPPAAVVEPGAVDLNRASEPDLIALPGIGPAKAAAIVAYRKKHGAFTRVEDLNKVKGFGRKTVAKLRTMVTVAVPPSLAAGPGGGSATP